MGSSTGAEMNREIVEERTKAGEALKGETEIAKQLEAAVPECEAVAKRRLRDIPSQTYPGPQQVVIGPEAVDEKEAAGEVSETSPDSG